MSAPIAATTGDGGSFYRVKSSSAWTEASTWASSFGGDGIQIGTETEAEREGLAGNEGGNNDPASTTAVTTRIINVTDSVRAWQGGADNNGWAIVGIHEPHGQLELLVL